MEAVSLLLIVGAAIGLLVYGRANARKHGRDRPPWKNDEREIRNGKK